MSNIIKTYTNFNLKKIWCNYVMTLVAILGVGLMLFFVGVYATCMLYIKLHTQ